MCRLHPPLFIFSSNPIHVPISDTNSNMFFVIIIVIIVVVLCIHPTSTTTYPALRAVAAVKLNKAAVNPAQHLSFKEQKYISKNRWKVKIFQRSLDKLCAGFTYKHATGTTVRFSKSNIWNWSARTIKINVYTVKKNPFQIRWKLHHFIWRVYSVLITTWQHVHATANSWCIWKQLKKNMLQHVKNQTKHLFKKMWRTEGTRGWGTSAKWLDIQWYWIGLFPSLSNIDVRNWTTKEEAYSCFIGCNTF